MDFTSATVQQALNSLSSCIRCRERRVGCDRLLPSCQACSAIGAECELYDHVLDAKFPRSYLQALHKRLQHLEALEQAVRPQPRPPAVHAARHPGSYPSLKSLKSSSPLSERSSSVPDSSQSANQTPLEPSRVGAENENFGEWGPSSAISYLRLITTLLNVELTRPLHQALNFKVDIPLTQPKPSFAGIPALDSPQLQLPPMETSCFLFEFYYNSIDTFIPVLGRKLGDQDLRQLYTNCSERQNMRACTRAQLALAIASRCLFRSTATQGDPARSQAYLQLSDNMFEAAAASLKLVLTDSTQLLDGVSPSAFENEETHAMAKLQIVLLLVCYVLCAPAKGNVWQLLGFAERLWRNIQNARAQLRRSNGPDGYLVREQSRHRPKPNLLYCSFISLERIVGMAFGRPIDFLDFAEAEEPSHRPEDKTVAALHASILEVKESVHAAYLAGQQDPGGIMGPAPGTPKAGSVEWYDGIRRQTDAWYDKWMDAVELMTRDGSPMDDTEIRPVGDGRKQFLLSSGRKWRDEALHLAFGFLIQNAPTPASTPASAGKSPSHHHRQLLSPDLVAEGRGIVQRLVHDYTYLLRQPFSITHQGAQIPLVFPRLWAFDMEIFRVAVTAAYLAHHRDDSCVAGAGGGKPPGSMTWELASCVKLLSKTTAEVVTDGLTEAILALVEDET